MTDRPLSEFFSYGQWGKNGESISGGGSTLAYTHAFRTLLEGLMKHLSVKVLVDAPCGDFNWMQHVDLSGVTYYGFDIVPEIIEENKANYATDKVTFDVADITTDSFPKADLMMVRDVLFHLPEANIFRFFENFVQGETEYLLTSTHFNRRNTDLARPGGFRLLNLHRPPYRLPQPLASLPDWHMTERRPVQRNMQLFSKPQIERWLEWKAAQG